MINNKEDIISGKAIEMIVSQGFDGLSMHKLAKSSNLSVATIYLYFENKEDLLNRLFNKVQQLFKDTVLLGFDPDMHFKDGLWLLWKNHYNFIKNHPVEFVFYKQFRSSYLINHSAIEKSKISDVIKDFARLAIKRKEIKPMEGEVFWSVAFGPFNQLAEFHLQKDTKTKQQFLINEQRLKLTFDMVFKSFN